MVPVLESLQKKYEGQIRVDFIDVKIKENREKVMKASINVIPTQIFYDSEGKEIFRHEGFLAEEDIKKIFKEKGFIK